MTGSGYIKNYTYTHHTTDYYTYYGKENVDTTAILYTYVPIT